jgi:hypothetical protein
MLSFKLSTVSGHLGSNMYMREGGLYLSILSTTPLEILMCFEGNRIERKDHTMEVNQVRRKYSSLIQTIDNIST